MVGGLFRRQQTQPSAGAQGEHREAGGSGEELGAFDRLGGEHAGGHDRVRSVEDGRRLNDSR